MLRSKYDASLTTLERSQYRSIMVLLDSNNEQNDNPFNEMKNNHE
ncbi:MAG: hypothetical protein ONB32_05860 [candidate division KSB1 bacterium]|nr:hypothetical protein [candidate division KSB1 bacterium]